MDSDSYYTRPRPFALPLIVSYRDPSSPFRVEATLTELQMTDGQPEQAPVATLTIGSGTLHDADKGAFPLDGLALTLRVTNGRMEPEVVLNPGVLSEFQQEGLLDAVSRYLNDITRGLSNADRGDANPQQFRGGP